MGPGVLPYPTGTCIRALSSVGRERLPYKQEVAGSNPAAPMRSEANSRLRECQLRAARKAELGENLPFPAELAVSRPAFRDCNGYPIGLL